VTDGAPPLADDLLAAAVTDDPHPHFRALRERDPVHYSERHRAWLISGYDDCAAVLADVQTFSSDRVRPLLEVMSPAQREAAAPVYAMIADWMVVMDPPAHRRLRRLAAAAFNPRRVAALADRVQQVIDELLTAFARSPRGDLIAGFSHPLPATVIAEVLGAPRQDMARFRAWSEALAHVAFGTGEGDRHARSLDGLREMSEYLDGLIALRRREPGEDMISDLLAASGGADALSTEEIKATCTLMLFAGHETTTSSIASAVLMLTRHPQQFALLRSDPERLAAGAVEEALRYEGPAKVLHRWVRRDATVGGREIRAGERVLVLLAAGNRDPARFPDPDAVDITRAPNPHMAFGRGIHACLGAQLARLEIRLALISLVTRLPGLRLADPDAALEWVPSLSSHGLRALPVAHDAPAGTGVSGGSRASAPR
jgi:cytochrome P450